MERIDKFTKKINAKDGDKIEGAIQKILKKDFAGFDIKKLKGHRELFRVRISGYRIIYRKSADIVEIIDVFKRDDTTYSKY